MAYYQAGPKPNLWMIFYGVGAITHTLIYTLLATRPVFFRENFVWAFSITNGITMGLLPYAVPSHLMELSHILVVLAVMAVTIGSGRLHAWVTRLTTFFISLPGNIEQFLTLRATVDEIFRLIDLADRRLYVAKERGRNQIEASADHWDTIQVQALEQDG